jgi:hypothetical protein
MWTYSFSCYTGLAYNEMAHLKIKNIQIGLVDPDETLKNSIKSIQYS